MSIAPSNSGAVNCAQILIIDDVIFEGDEQFLVMIGSISDDEVTEGDITQTCVTIEDDDGWLNEYIQHFRCFKC